MDDLYLSYREDEEESPWLAEVRLASGVRFAGSGISAIAAVVNCAVSMKKYLDQAEVEV